MDIPEDAPRHAILEEDTLDWEGKIGNGHFRLVCRFTHRGCGQSSCNCCPSNELNDYVADPDAYTW